MIFDRTSYCGHNVVLFDHYDGNVQSMSDKIVRIHPTCYVNCNENENKELYDINNIDTK